jgi:hypothetical protein
LHWVQLPLLPPLLFLWQPLLLHLLLAHLLRP